MGNVNEAPSNAENRILSLETISGKTPDRKNLPFVITTEEAEKFIQQKLDSVRYRLIKSGAIGEDEPQLKISLFSVAGSDRFFPFILTLPMSATKSMVNKKKNQQVDSFFTNEEDHSGKKNVLLKDYVYKLLMVYSYKKGTFEDNNFKRDTGINRHQQSELIKLATPKIVTDRSNGSSVVALVLDPIKVFIDMLIFKSEATDRGAISRIRVDINDVRKKESGRYIYFVTKYYSKGNKKHTSGFADQLNFRLRG